MTAIHPDDREVASGSFWGGVRSGQGFTFEARFRRVCDGAYRWHLNRAVVLRDTAGEILRFVGTSTDIDDLKQSQDDLRRADERTRLIVETALDAVVTMNSQGEITSWNKQAEIIFGWGPAEAIGRHMADMIIPAQHRAAHELGLRRFLATGEGPILRRRIEIMAVRRSGAEFPVELEVVPVRLRHDWVFSAFIRDITESRLARGKAAGERAPPSQNDGDDSRDALERDSQKARSTTAILAYSTTRASRPKSSWETVGSKFFIRTTLIGPLDCGCPVSQPERLTGSRFAPSAWPAACTGGV